MTIAAVVLQAGPFSGNGVTTAFPFAFKCFSKAEMIWTWRSALGVEAPLVLDLDYSVALNVDQNATPGGTVTFPLGGSAYAILAAGQKLVGVSNAPETQLTALVAAGGWFPQVVEDALDRMVLLTQQLSQLLTRTVSYPVTDTVVGATLPTSTTRANMFLAFDASGNPIAAAAVTGVAASVAMQPVLSAATLALARAALGLNTQNLWCGTATGTGNALTLTPSFAASALLAGLMLTFKASGTPNSGATTINVSGLGVIAAQADGAAMVGGEITANKWYMAIYDGAAFQVVQIAPEVLLSLFTTKGDMVAATAAGAVSRLAVGATGQALIADSALTAGVGYAVRNLERSQCPLNGNVDTNGLANFLTTGAGLKPGLTATAVPLLLAFGIGYDAGGNIDATALLSADVADILGVNLPVSNTNYIFADRSSASAVVWGSTLAPPQAREFYDQTKQSVLQFAGAAGATTFLDDFGNTYTAQGNARVQTNQFKFGTGGLGGGGAANVLNGSTDFIRSNNILSMGYNGWSMRCWVYPTVLPGVGVNACFMSLGNAGGNFGVRGDIFNSAGSIKFTYYLSTNGSSYDIANAVQGTTTPVINTWYFVELTFDALAGVYRLYVNGAQEASTASVGRIAQSSNMTWGCSNAGSSGLVGYLDKPEFLPYCSHPAGTSYAGSLPAAAPDVTTVGYASEFYDIVKRKLFGVTAASSAAGANPTFTAKTRVYAGECDTSGAAVTAARSYAYKGRCNTASSVLAAALTTFTHNIGTLPRQTRVIFTCVFNDSGTFFPLGDELGDFNGTVAGATNANGYSTQHKRNTSALVVSAVTLYLMTGPTGTIGSPNNYNHFFVRLYLDRGW